MKIMKKWVKKETRNLVNKKLSIQCNTDAVHLKIVKSNLRMMKFLFSISIVNKNNNKNKVKLDQ